MGKKYSQKNFPLQVVTGLGEDILLLTGFSGHEAVSQLFSFQLNMLAENTDVDQKKVAFHDILGKSVTINLGLPGGKDKRYFRGICSRISQGERDEVFTSYRMEVVPRFWLATKRARSQVFPQMTVPEILLKTLADYGVRHSVKLEGKFEKRDYCVQYRETDFNFASRLMEEEGIYFFFVHEASRHTMVLANTPQGHGDLKQITYENMVAGEPANDRIYDWEKVQELRSGKNTLWDHCFELPQDHLAAPAEIKPPSVQVGKDAHKLTVGVNDKLEIYDYPGEYAQRFDGIDQGGGEQKAELTKIAADGKRAAKIRMEEEAAASLVIQGASGCRQLSSGHKFTLEKHFNADGKYVLTGVQHFADMSGAYRSQSSQFSYSNSFTCIPAEIPFRPPRRTPKPFVQGTQTGYVVGPSGQEIYTDKYGRVKVQFHWDREGKSDGKNSCWARVGTSWAGKQWPAISIPRVGQEVIVAFEEGDPDQPIIVGSVYNFEMMPPYKLPDNKTQSGIKSRSTLNGGPDNFNELRFEDKKGSEDIYFHAEKDFHRVVENDDDLKVGRNQTIEVKTDRTETVKEGNELVTVSKGNRTILVDTGNDMHQVKKGNRDVLVDTGNDKHQIKKGNRDVLIDMGNDTLTIKMGNQTTKLNLGASQTEAMQSIQLKVGQSSIKIDQMGITIKGMMIKIEGQVQTQVKGLMTQVNGDAMLQVKGGITMIN